MLSTTTPSRRNTTRSAQAACRASWVTSSAGRAGVAARAQQPQHLLAGLGVEGTGRLVGEHEPPLADQRAGDRDPLLLAAGHLVGEAVGELGDADLARARRRASGGPCATRSPSSSSGRATFSAAVSAGIRLKSWKT